MDWREALAAYLKARLPAADSVEVTRVGGMPAGASNQTLSLDIRVTCEGVPADVPLVLRPERPDGILAPYDIERQFRVLRALSRTEVPVPAVMWHERDATVLGAPFFLMHRLACETLPLFWYGESSRRLASAACSRPLPLGHRAMAFPAAQPPRPLFCARLGMAAMPPAPKPWSIS